MSLDSGQGISYDNVRIFFEDLSEEAKKQALEHKGISSFMEVNWDVFEMCVVAEGTKYGMSQDEIDMAALSMIGYYNNTTNQQGKRL